MRRLISLMLFLLIAIPVLYTVTPIRYADAAVGINNLPNVTISQPTATTFRLYSTINIRAYGSDSDGYIKSMRLVIKKGDGTVLVNKTFYSSSINYNYYANVKGSKYIYVTATDNIGDSKTVSKYICIGSCVVIQ